MRPIEWTTGKIAMVCLTVVACMGIFSWTLTRTSEITSIERIEHDKERPRKFWEKEAAGE